MAVEGILNLTNDTSFTAAIPVPSSAVLAVVQIITDTDTYAWGDATVGMQFSIVDEHDSWDDFEGTSYTFSSSQTLRQRLSIAGMRWVRFKTTAADGGADPNASVWIHFA